MLTRILPLIFVLGLGAALWFSPPADGARLAAQQVPAVLDGSTQDGGTLREALLASPAVTEVSESEQRLDLGTVVLANFREEAVGEDVHAQLRASILRGLRAGMPPNVSLSVTGEAEASPTGADFEASYDGETLRLACTLPGQDGSTPLEASTPWSPPDKTSLIPPLVAIVLAILLRRPVISLFLGVISAAWLLRRAADPEGSLGSQVSASLAYRPDSLAAEAPTGWLAPWFQENLPDILLNRAPVRSVLQDTVPRVESAVAHFPDWFTDFFWPQFWNTGRAQLIGFVIFMLAMVGIVTRAGGIRGLMERIAGLAKGVRSTQVCTFFMGLAVFFDDYANTILVGSTMRPLTDRFKIAREKLAYLVDSTAAPVAGLAILSTWIAYEVSTFQAQLPAAGLAASQGYEVFLQSLPFRFYCIFTLLLVALIAITGRDFGPMLHAERRARHKNQLVRPGAKPMVGKHGTELAPKEGVTPRANTALWPIGTFLFVTLNEIARAGGAYDISLGELFTIEGATNVLYNGSGNRPLVVGSGSGLLVAVIMAQAHGLRLFRDILGAALGTLRSMGVAVVILYLAWMIGAACGALGTASYLSVLAGGGIHAPLLPSLLFLLAAVVAFSTGSSWSTMSILLPLVVGLAYSLGEAAGIEGLTGHLLMLISIGAVLEGAIFGDHCSPISDTTVLSSTASASDHIDHVRTQAPYAVLTMVTALGAGYLPCAFLPAWKPIHGILSGSVFLLLFVLFVGRRAESRPFDGEDEPPTESEASAA